MSEFCEISNYPVRDEEILQILKDCKRVAVVGLSLKRERDSFVVASFLKERGFRVIPVNPNHGEILGETSYPSLKDIPEPVEIVDIFRKPEAVLRVVEEAIEIGANVVWMQRGIVSNAAAELARKAGLKVIMDRCIKVEAEKHGIFH